MEKHHYGHGSEGIGRSVPSGDREEFHPSNLYPSRLRKIQKHAEEETRGRVNREGVGKVLKILKEQSYQERGN